MSAGQAQVGKHQEGGVLGQGEEKAWPGLGPGETRRELAGLGQWFGPNEDAKGCSHLLRILQEH